MDGYFKKKIFSAKWPNLQWSLYKKCLSVHDCPICKNYISTNVHCNNILLFFKSNEESSVGGLTSPIKLFVEYLQILESIFTEVFTKFLKTPGVGVKIFENLCQVNHEFLSLCKNFPTTYLLKLFVRVRIYYCIKFYNAELKCTKDTKRKLQILKHL